MKALVYKKFGPPDVLEWVDGWPEPGVSSHHVLVRVEAGGINPKDILLRKGKFSRTLARDPLPRVSGLDMAGEVVAVGPGVSKFATGDKVFGMTNRFSGGVHAELASLKETEICLAPETISLVEASSVPLAAQTALQALRDYCDIRNGQALLINGASGGVGHFAVQIGKLLGVEVHAVCGPGNIQFVESLGADRVYSYKDQPANSIERSFNAVFDVFGKQTCRAFARHLGKHGIYVSTVPKRETFLGEAMAMLGLSRRSRLVFVRSSSRDLQQLREWIDAGLLRPFLEETYPVERAGDAHRHIESRHTVGKVAIRIGAA